MTSELAQDANPQIDTSKPQPQAPQQQEMPLAMVHGQAVLQIPQEYLAQTLADYGLADQAFYTAENLTDPTVFNFFDNLVAGPNSEARSRLLV